MYTFKGINTALKGMARELLTNGVRREVRGTIRYEMPDPVLIKITNPANRYVLIPERKWPYLLGPAEALWLASGSNVLSDLPGIYVKSLYDYSDDGETWRACFTGDTLIPLLSGELVPIKELILRESFWVYSKDSKGDVVPGFGHSCRITQKATELCEITLDNLEKITCTPNHRFLLKNGSYKEARLLSAEDSLSPLYRRNSKIWGYHEGYLDVKHDSGEWELMHRVVGRLLDHGIFESEKPQLHHMDFNPRNNNPSNLIWLSNLEHRRIHADQARIIKANMLESIPEFKDKHRENCIKNARKGTEVQIQAYQEDSDLAKRLSSVRSENMQKLNKKTESVSKIKGRVFKVFDRLVSSGFLITSEMYDLTRNRQAGVPNLKKVIKLFGSFDAAIIEHEARKNHRVVSMVIVKIEPTEVYDFTVDKYHNFALQAGVFVHNCYGPRFRSYTGSREQYHQHAFEPVITNSIDQFKFIYESLKRDLYSLQAVITIADPNKDCYDLNGDLIVTKDMPCNRSLHFQVTPDGKLDLIVHVRSNDCLFGFGVSNVFCFTWFQEMFANMLQIPMGSYYTSADNFHYYESKRSMMEAVAQTSFDVDYVDGDFQYLQIPDLDLDNFDNMVQKALYEEEIIRNDASGNHIQFTHFPSFSDLIVPFRVKNGKPVKEIHHPQLAQLIHSLKE